MKIKTKLSLGLAFLFFVILLLGGLGAYYLNKVSHESKEIIKDNYESIELAESMRQIVDNEQWIMDNEKLSIFEKYLTLQENNITETGEKQITTELRNDFNQLKKITENNLSLSSIQSSLSIVNYQLSIKKLLHKIITINMQAIVRKNAQVQETAQRVLSYMALIGTICFLIVFTFILNFPGYIANPIHELTESIKEIANKNYSHRLYFKSKDEFGELAEAFNKMAQKLDEYEHSNLAEILFEKKRIDTIIRNMSDAIIGIDEKKRILFANPVACDLLGIQEKDLLEKYSPDIAAVNDLMRNLIKDLMRGNSEKKEATPIKIFANGKESYFTKEIFDVTTTKTAEETILLIGHVIVLKNITRFQELDLAKTNFIATISHELKTPIASIKMSSKLLNDDRIGGLNGEQQQLVQNIREESERLLKITGELLDLTQVETGNIQLNFQAVEPKQIIDYAYDALKFQADQKKIKIEIHADNNLPKVNADLEKAAWVMVNLLSNAIRYSPEQSSIIIEAKQDKNTILFSVKDVGKGIDKKYQARIFDKFFQIPNSEKSGTGLGLAIAKEFIEAQGGKIWLESEIGKGSKFYLSLPIVK